MDVSPRARRILQRYFVLSGAVIGALIILGFLAYALYDSLAVLLFIPGLLEIWVVGLVILGLYLMALERASERS